MLVHFAIAVLSMATLCAGSAPGVRIEDPTRELGQVWPGEKRTETFRLVNEGPGPMRILDLRPECGCLEAKASRTFLFLDP